MGEATAPAQTIVVGLSGSEGSLRALEWAGRMAATGDVRIVCATVEPGPPSTALFGAVPAVPYAELSLDIAADAISTLAASASAAGLRTLPATAHVCIAGEVVSGLRDVATAHHADLVVLGAGKGAPRRQARSLVERLSRRVSCPVVVVP